MTDRLVARHATFRVDEMARKERVDKSRLAETCLAYDNHVKLEASFEKLLFDLLCDGVETDIGLKVDL